MQLNGLTHSWQADLDVLLVGPTGERAMLMSDGGGNHDVNAINLQFSHTAATPLPQSTVLSTDTVLPGNYVHDDIPSDFSDPFPAPAPAVLSREPADLIRFSSLFDTSQTITLGGSPLEIYESMTIQGPGADLLTISGNDASRVFVFLGFGSVTLSGLTVRNGFTADDGGGIYSETGFLNLRNVAVAGNPLRRATQRACSCSLAGTSSPAARSAITNRPTTALPSCSTPPQAPR